ncbi:hypothetical protein MKW98_010961 [Papaver atlanticum]|uniref:3'-5' exonuclease domain-containing protein n=1 Tax=Papaver atlanticum TaxID=357466 RepID=A0AAD4XWF1_9MAGN|nr:hypothetical protein MKW98_010961 [Papaver atlanticum]
MTIEVFIRDLPNHYPDTQDVYSINVDNEHVYTVVTKNASAVEHWIERIYVDYNDFLHNLVVGLDVEWNPYYYSGVATLQLCVGRRSLIFQMIHADEIPEALHGFLSNPKFKFVGVGIQSDVDKLRCDYNLGVMNASDLGSLKNVGLMGLARVVLGCGEIEKPINVTLSNWDQYHLTSAHIKYACVDAYVSFKIGKQLLQVCF